MDNVKVYCMNEYSYFASKWSIEETNKFYEENYDENDIDGVDEIDIDTETMWGEIHLEDIKSDEVVKELTRFNQLGDVINRGGSYFRLFTYREVLDNNGDFTEPYEISTSEW